SAPTDVPAQLSVTDVRRLWPEVLEEVKGKRRFTWILLSQNAQVADVRDGTLTLAMANAGARDSFGRGGSEDILREALIVVLGADFRIVTMVDVSAAPPAPPPPPRKAWPEPSSETAAAGQQARQHIRTTRAASSTGESNGGAEPVDDRDAAADRTDAELDDSTVSDTDLLARHLGAEIIAEEEHGA
ncbi:MAG TPA: DNA polymerase III subunit gamma/tau, partial [Propionibacteriaceae bacterium]|nr:DNA polymerase III subunit gamma/tau [Propionibacteriaceae bacterium]